MKRKGPARGGVSMSVTSILDNIRERMRAIGGERIARLRPGLPRETILSFDSRLPFRLPESVLELYSWRNGGVDRYAAEMLPGWFFISIEEAMSFYEMFREEVPPGAPPECLFWQPEWFPIFKSYDISAIGVVCGGERSNDGAMVYYDHPGETGLEAVSLTALLQTIATALDRSIIKVTEDGSLDMDQDRFAEVAAEIAQSGMG